MVSMPLRNSAVSHDMEGALAFLTKAGIAVDEIAPQVEEKFLSAFIRAHEARCPMLWPGCCTPEAIAGESMT
jgi:arsenite methyltransferase